MAPPPLITRAAGFLLMALGLALPAPSRAAFKYFNPADTSRIPLLLSQTGLYADLPGQIPAPEAVAYAVNAPLWSDGAAARRWIILPPGRSVPYREGDLFDYPDSTVFAETFQVEGMPGTAGAVPWETRLLIRKIDTALSPRRDWYGFSYRWNAARNDAALTARDPFRGFDTAFLQVDQGRHTYRKWRFPSSFECGKCHRNGMGSDAGKTPGRAVLGFIPPQLKRPSSGGGNQLLELFDAGVFSGSRPGPAELARRFKGLPEPLPASGEARFRALDTLARSYLAANCSQCHGARGMAVGAAAGTDLDFDFHDLQPRQELGGKTGFAEGLNHVAPFDTAARPEKRNYFILAVAQAGMDTAAGATWDMALPPHNDPGDLEEAIVYPGYPSLSTALFKQWARATTWSDSARMRRRLISYSASEDSATAALGRERLGWMFSRAWGSREWLDTLARHGFTVDSVTDGYAWESDAPKQMPPLASSFAPDTAALRLLGEWVKHYRSDSLSGVRGRAPVGGRAHLRGRLMVLPSDWSGPVSMHDIRGRAYGLQSLGRGIYALPPSAPPGIYFFRAGKKSLSAALLAR